MKYAAASTKKAMSKTQEDPLRSVFSITPFSLPTLHPRHYWKKFGPVAESI